MHLGDTNGTVSGPRAGTDYPTCTPPSLPAQGHLPSQLLLPPIQKGLDEAGQFTLPFFLGKKQRFYHIFFFSLNMKRNVKKNILVENSHLKVGKIEVNIT